MSPTEYLDVVKERLLSEPIAITKPITFHHKTAQSMHFSGLTNSYNRAIIRLPAEKCEIDNQINQNLAQSSIGRRAAMQIDSRLKRVLRCVL